MIGCGGAQRSSRFFPASTAAPVSVTPAAVSPSVCDPLETYVNVNCVHPRISHELLKGLSQSSKRRFLTFTDSLLANAQVFRELGLRLALPENLLKQPPISSG
jgi:hypothetical protein